MLSEVLHESLADFSPGRSNFACTVVRRRRTRCPERVANQYRLVGFPAVKG
jgi:hypothetical protein